MKIIAPLESCQQFSVSWFGVQALACPQQPEDIRVSQIQKSHHKDTKIHTGKRVVDLCVFASLW